MHEAQMHKENCFITLTYDGLCSPSLNYKDYQRFMYRLRQAIGSVRFFMSGEYGEMGLRPHFHALIFGRSFSNDGKLGENIYRSRVLERLWPHGYSSVGAVSFESAGYVAKYTQKKVSGDLADAHYTRLDERTGELVRVVPEFGRMSLRPGIGYKWFQKYWREVYGPRDGVVRPGGFVVPPPRYYDKLLVELPEDAKGEYSERVEFDRFVRSQQFRGECTPDRLFVRELCAVSKAAFTKKSKL